MAIIYTYPLKSTPTSSDLVLISDAADKNKTKNAKISDIQNLISGVNSLNTLAGAVTLSEGTGITLTTTGNDIEVSSNAASIGTGIQFSVPLWGTTTTLTNSPITTSGLSQEDIIIPRYIKHLGNLGNFFGFVSNGEFIVQRDTLGTDTILLTDNSFTVTTDSKNKIIVTSSGVSLLNDSFPTSSSKKVVETMSEGISVYAGTDSVGSVAPGSVRLYNSAGSSYVGIAGNSLQAEGLSYVLRMPAAVGGRNQGLKLPSSIGTTPFQLEWGDIGGPGAGTTNRLAYWGASGETLLSSGISYTTNSASPNATTTTNLLAPSNLSTINIGETTGGRVNISSAGVTTSGVLHGTTLIGAANVLNIQALGGTTLENPPSISIGSSNNSKTTGFYQPTGVGLTNNSWTFTSEGEDVVNFNKTVGAYFSDNKKIQLSRSTDDNTGTSRLAAPVYINQSSTNATPTTNIWTQVSTTGAQKCISFGFNNGEAGFIRPTSSSAIEINGYTSDERLKTDIIDWDDKVLDKFKAINPKKYKYTKDKELGIEKEFKGFIAQDMQDKFPEAYKKDLPTEESGLEYYYFDPIAMITPLMKAIKELNEKIEVLESK